MTSEDDYLSFCQKKGEETLMWQQRTIWRQEKEKFGRNNHAFIFILIKGCGGILLMQLGKEDGLDQCFSEFSVHRNHCMLLKYRFRFRRTGAGLIPCISKKPSGDDHTLNSENLEIGLNTC